MLRKAANNCLSAKIGLAGGARRGAVSVDSAAGVGCSPQRHDLFPWFASDLIQKALPLVKRLIDK